MSKKSISFWNGFLSILDINPSKNEKIEVKYCKTKNFNEIINSFEGNVIEGNNEALQPKFVELDKIKKISKQTTKDYDYIFKKITDYDKNKE